MKVSQLWLFDHYPFSPETSPATVIAQALTDGGLEVEHIDNRAAQLRSMVTGKVIRKENHPKADKLSVCTVDVHAAETLTIVCGAPNVAEGQIVAVALEGAVIPNGGFAIARRMLRGVESQGMICSQHELNLGDEADGIWVLPAETAIGIPLAEALGQTDVVYDVAITPNRADALSHRGIARDIALRIPNASGNHELLPCAVPELSVDDSVQAVRIHVEDPTMCPLFLALPISGVRPVASPQWLQDRLNAIGIKPRNILVDATNYVMMDLGQPLHAYDARQVADRTFVVRTAGSAQTFATLDGKERSLTSDMLLICDPQRPLGIAGVMGGANSEIADDTTDVILEAAVFAPSSVRKTAKALDLSTDASYRFERGVDAATTELALMRAASLIVETAGGRIGVTTKAGAVPPPPAPIRLRTPRVQTMLGVDVSTERIRQIMEGIGCTIVDTTDDACMVIAPSWRVDIVAEIDLIEEVMRVIGIDAIPPTSHARVAVLSDGLPDAVRAGTRGPSLRRAAVTQGFVECRTTAQTSPEASALSLPTGAQAVAVANPLGRELSMLRTSLLPGLVQVAARNMRTGAQSLRLAEVGKTFLMDASSTTGVAETERFALLLCGTAQRHWSSGSRTTDFYDALGAVRSVLQASGCRDVSFTQAGETSPLWSVNTVTIHADGIAVGLVGQLAPAALAQHDVSVPVFAAEVDVRTLPSVVRTYRPVSPYPSIDRDVALIVDHSVTAGTLVATAYAAGLELLRDVTVFDVFANAKALGDGKKSIGLALQFRSDTRTLTDADVDPLVAAIIDAAARNHGAVLRGAPTSQA
ncbi:MAG: phenylalanine--tRNA ligase subunit beta [Candidatus Kapabacteria bacterium]|nr:phenylalanine--tRNA ligase subunit beta [Candidatus Kapabacteria bacterium]